MWGSGGRVVSQGGCPPEQFALVEKGVYRSAYPIEEHVPFLRHLHIKTVVLLSIETLPSSVRRSLEAEYAVGGSPGGDTTPKTSTLRAAATAVETATWRRDGADRTAIHVLQLADLNSWRRDEMNSGDDFSQQDVQNALSIAVDVRWHPVLFACPTGELQTSVVVGCMRRYQCWTLAAIYSECELFATLVRPLRSSVMTFISQWSPDELPGTVSALMHQYQENGHKTSAMAASTPSSRRRRHRAQAGRESVDELSSSGDDVEEEQQGSYGGGGGGGFLGVGNGSAPAAVAVVTPSLATSVEDVNGLTLHDSALSVDALATGSLDQRPRQAGTGVVTTPGEGGRAVAATPLNQDEPRDESGHAGGGTAAAGLAQLGMELAEWFVKAQNYRARRGGLHADEGVTEAARVEQHITTGLPPPHMRYAGVRNPPALDERSTFTKESLVEEDDD